MKNNIGLMLDRDLSRGGLAQKEFATLLRTHGDRKITEAAVSNWKKRNKIPNKWVARVLEILGSESELCAYFGSKPETDTRPPKTGTQPVKDKHQALSALQVATLESLEKFMRQGGFTDANCVQLLGQCVVTGHDGDR